MPREPATSSTWPKVPLWLSRVARGRCAAARSPRPSPAQRRPSTRRVGSGGEPDVRQPEASDVPRRGVHDQARFRDNRRSPSRSPAPPRRPRRPRSAARPEGRSTASTGMPRELMRRDRRRARGARAGGVEPVPSSASHDQVGGRRASPPAASGGSVVADGEFDSGGPGCVPGPARVGAQVPAGRRRGRPACRRRELQQTRAATRPSPPLLPRPQKSATRRPRTGPRRSSAACGDAPAGALHELGHRDPVALGGAAVDRRHLPRGRELHGVPAARTRRQTAWAATPSRRPTKPRPSVVVALIPTFAPGSPSARGDRRAHRRLVRREARRLGEDAAVDLQRGPACGGEDRDGAPQQLEARNPAKRGVAVGEVRGRCRRGRRRRAARRRSRARARRRRSGRPGRARAVCVTPPRTSAPALGEGVDVEPRADAQPGVAAHGRGHPVARARPTSARASARSSRVVILKFSLEPGTTRTG